MPDARYIVELATAAGADPGKWTDISADVYAGDSGAITYKRGRDDILSRVQPGEATFSVVNDDGKYSPGNTGSALYPHVDSMRAVRITAEFEAGSSLSCNGGSDYATAGQIDIDNRDFTVALWVYFDDLASNYGLLGIREANATRKSLHLHNFTDGRLRMGFYGDDMDTAAGVVAAGAWYHLAFTFNETTKSRTIYVDGAAVKTATAGGSFNGQSATTLIGAMHVSRFQLKGAVDDLRIYQRELSATEVSDLYNGGHGRYGWLTEDSLAAAWHFDEGSGSTAADFSGNGMTATLQGSATWATGKVLRGYALFYGFINTVKPDPHPDVMRASISLFDGFEWLNLAKATPTYANVASGTSIIAALDEISWPARLRAIDTGQSTFTPSYSDTTIKSQVEGIGGDNEAGLVMFDGEGKLVFEGRHHRLSSPHDTSQTTFTDTSGILGMVPERPSRDIRNQVKVSHTGGGSITVDDATSQASYGIRRRDLTAAFITALEATDRGNWVLTREANPRDRPVIVVHGNSTAALLTAILARKISDRITVTDSNQGTGINEDFFVESLHGVIDVAGKRHVVRYQCEPVDLGGWWALGAGTLGTTTKLAY